MPQYREGPDKDIIIYGCPVNDLQSRQFNLVYKTHEVRPYTTRLRAWRSPTGRWIRFAPFRIHNQEVYDRPRLRTENKKAVKRYI